MRVTLSLNITAETFTECIFVAYSCEKPCGFFHKSCPVGNLQLEIVFRCAVPMHRIACLKKYGVGDINQNTVSNVQVLLCLDNQVTKVPLAPTSDFTFF
jgi:hypothetical protein